MTTYWYLSWSLLVGLVDVALEMWWPAIGGYHVGAIGSCLFNNVSLLAYFLTLLPSVTLESSVKCFAELPATLVSELGCHVGINFK